MEMSPSKQGVWQMRHQDRAAKHQCPSPETLEYLRIDPEVVEQHLAVALPEHKRITESRGHQDRYLSLHRDRLIPLVNRDPVTPLRRAS